MILIYYFRKLREKLVSYNLSAIQYHASSVSALEVGQLYPNTMMSAQINVLSILSIILRQSLNSRKYYN